MVERYIRSRRTEKPIVHKFSPRLGVAVRMGGMGVAIGALVGEEGADCILAEV